MLDLEAIKKRHLDPERNRGRTYYEGHIEVDLAALVEEVEQLRKERPAVVAWLRSVGCRMANGSEHEFVLLSVADAVENGEHRREEKTK